MRRPMLEQQLARPGGVRALVRIGELDHRRRDLRPPLAVDGAGPGVRRCGGAPVAGLHRRDRHPRRRRPQLRRRCCRVNAMTEEEEAPACANRLAGKPADPAAAIAAAEGVQYRVASRRSQGAPVAVEQVDSQSANLTRSARAAGDGQPPSRLTNSAPLTISCLGFASKSAWFWTCLLTPDGASSAPCPRVDNGMVKALARAFRWRKMLDTGVHATLENMAAAKGVNPTYVSRDSAPQPPGP